MANEPFPKDEYAGLYGTKDRWMFIFIAMYGHEVKKVKRSGPVVTFYFDHAAVKEIVQSFFSNKPLPHPDIRNLIISEQLFNSLTKRTLD